MVSIVENCNRVGDRIPNSQRLVEACEPNAVPTCVLNPLKSIEVYTLTINSVIQSIKEWSFGV